MDFNRKTLQLLSTSSYGRIGLNSFRQLLPTITRQIELDRGAKWLNSWGQSQNIDEHENLRIVDPKILNAIGRFARHPIRDGNAYHAGLLHTYGYLFSRLKTRYGYKRKRWTEGTLEKGLNLKDKTLSPTPRSGTLLRNVTYLLSRISLRHFDHTQFENDDDPTITEKAAKQLTVQRIVERASLDTGSPIRLISDLVKFKKQVDGYSDLLIYSFELAKQQKLITCFPISKSMKSTLLSIARENSAPIELQFNAVIPRFPKSGIKGTRKVTELKL